MRNETEENIKDTDTVLNNIEKSLWTAVRVLEQRKMLLNSIDHHSRGIQLQVEEIDLHILHLKSVLKNIS
jgi:hypothetical protein